MSTVTETVNVRFNPQGDKETIGSIRTISIAADNLSKKVITIRFDAQGKKISETTRTITREMQALDKEVRNTTASFSLLGRVVATAAVSKAIHTIVGLTDSFTNLKSKLAVVGNGVGQVELAIERLLGVTDRSRTSMESAVTVYTRTSRAMEGYGKNAVAVTRFTETLSKAVMVGGSTSVEASNAMIQLSQGMSSGTLRGDELRSVMEQLPFVAKLIAKEFGVTTGELKALGADGKLVTDRVFNAIIKGTKDVEESFAKMRPTVAQAWEVFKNHAVVAAERFQDSTGKIAEMLLKLSQNFDTLIRVGESLAYVIGILLAGRAIQSLVVAFTALAAVNPFLAIAAGAGLATAAIIPFADKIQLSTDRVGTLKDAWTVIQADVVSGAKSMGQALQDYVLPALTNMKEGFASLVDLTIPGGSMWGALMNGTYSQYLRDTKNGDTRSYAEYARDTLKSGPAAQAAASTSLDAGDMWAAVTPFLGANATMALRHGLAGLKGYASEVQDRADLAGVQRLTAQSKLDEAAAERKRFAEAMAEMRSPITKKPVASTDKPSGKTMEEILRELRDGLKVTLVGDERERTIQKRIEAEMDKLGKGRTSTAGQRKELESLIRQIEELEFGRDRSEQLGDRISKQMSESFKNERERQAKISTGLGERVSQGRDEAARQIRENDESVRQALDPMIKYNEEWQKYQDFVTRNPEQVDKVNQHLAMQTPMVQQLSSGFTNLGQSIGDAFGNAIVYGEKLSDTLNNIAKQLASSTISNLFQVGFQATLQGLGVPAGPPVLGQRVTVGTGAKGGYFRSGGYTGNGNVADVAGIVHGREFVVNANATARNRSALEAMNAGRNIAPTVTIHNYAGVQVEAQGLSAGEIQVMIRKGVAEYAPAAVAADMAHVNSRTSKAVMRNFETRRNR